MSSANDKKLYLVALSLGPVQDFIAAARRTRDLWFGSHLLSEISKAAAYALHKDKGEHIDAGLIFPATNHPEIDLQPCDSNWDENEKTPFIVPNKILAVIETDDPKAVMEQAKEAAQKRWEQLAEDPFGPSKRPQLSKKSIDGEIWNQQLNDLLELFAAWIAYDPQKEGYTKKRQRLESLLVARKNTRNFNVSEVQGDRIPKSSLDGLRESVIHGNKLRSWEKRALGLSAGEELDCPGLVKRRGGDPEQFRPLSRIAVDPWLRHINAPLPEPLIKLIRLIHSADLGLVSKVRGLDNQYGFDGQLLYPFRIDAELSRLESLRKNDDINQDNYENTKKLLKDLKPLVTELTKAHDEPCPYVAVLAADGDRMGELIDRASSKKEHRNISIVLSGFANQVASLAAKHHGQLIYAGGDDVLMLVPLDTMLDCATALKEKFNKLWDGLEGFKFNEQNKKPTLSVGIGISHMLTPMGRQLALAREAEQIAKANQHPDLDQRKDGFAILYQPRSGERIEFREQWSNSPEATLAHWQKLHASQELPYRAAFQLRELGRVIDGWCDTQHKLLPKEIYRVLDRKRILKDKKVDAKVINDICDRGTKLGLSKLADELVLTQKLAKHTTFTTVSDAAEKEGNHA